MEFDLGDVVVMVESGQADEALAAFKATRANYPGSVLSKLPDADGQPCHFVALTGARVQGDQPSAPEERGKLSKQQQAALRGDIKKFVRESADEVRAAREQLESAVTRSSVSDAYSKSLALDTALDHLKDMCADGLEEAVAGFELSEEETDSSESTTNAEGRDTRAYSERRDQALGQFAGVAAKGGLGKLFSKSKIKAAGDELLSATDSLVESRGADLVDELVDRARPLLVQRESEKIERNWVSAVAQLSKATDVALSGLTTPTGIDASATVRPWTKGTPEPRHYVVADPGMLDQLDLEFDATQVGVEGFDGVYVLQAQHALSKASLAHD